MYQLYIDGVNMRGSYVSTGTNYDWIHKLKDIQFIEGDAYNFHNLKIGYPGWFIEFRFSFTFNPIGTGFGDNYFKAEKQTFKVYPNPCENTLNIEADGLKRIFDTSGRLVLESYENSVDMRDLAPGVYIVMLENGSTKKVIKRN